jgi:DNA-binding PadR family transcriptional regulator
MREDSTKQWILKKLAEKPQIQQELLKQMEKDKTYRVARGTLCKYVNSLSQGKFIYIKAERPTGKGKTRQVLYLTPKGKREILSGLVAKSRPKPLDIALSNDTVRTIMNELLSQEAIKLLNEIMTVSGKTDTKQTIEDCVTAVSDVQFWIRWLVFGQSDTEQKTTVEEHLGTLEEIGKAMESFTGCVVPKPTDFREACPTSESNKNQIGATNK